jgi:hypothetical protein
MPAQHEGDDTPITFVNVGMDAEQCALETGKDERSGSWVGDAGRGEDRVCHPGRTPDVQWDQA